MPQRGISVYEGARVRLECEWGEFFFLVYEILVSSNVIRMYLGSDTTPIGGEVETSKKDPYHLTAVMLKGFIDFDARSSTLELVSDNATIRDSSRFV